MCYNIAVAGDGKASAMSYNLLEEHWIPVLYRDGRYARVGIRTALGESGRIREIAASNPMDRVAMLRFLLSLQYWCLGVPLGKLTEWPARGLDKLAASRQMFDLLGDGARFYQDATAQRTRAVTDLFQEIPTGNNFWHFRHATDGQDGLCLACCAAGLLRLPMFSVSGLPDLKAGINGAPPIYVMPMGGSLLESLCLNWRPTVTLGEPAWERKGWEPWTGKTVPLLTGLTMLSRRVHLHSPGAPGGRCVNCGAECNELVRQCEFQSAGPQQTEEWDDPHVLYVVEKQRRSLRAQDLTNRYFKMDRPWSGLLREIVAKFAVSGERRDVLVTGFATDNAKNIDVWERRITLPPATDAANRELSQMCEQWDEQGALLSYRIRRTGKGSECAAAITGVRPHVEHGVSQGLELLAAGGREPWERAAEGYAPVMRAVAQSLSPGLTTGAVRRRAEIASVRPDMRPKQPQAGRKSKPKKEAQSE